MIPISKPLIGEEEQAAVQAVLASGVIAQGSRVAAFEQAFAAYIGVKHAIATSNGTTALHTALLAHGVGPGDEVITTPFTFIASVNSILFTGATPVLVDIDEHFTIDPQQVEQAITPRTKAIMPVHLYGQTADMDALCNIADKYGLALIEDACQAHGATYDGRMAGSFGTGCFSFYATKNMTTGEGGMITTNDDAVAEQARQIIAHGMRVRYYHHRLGYNYRTTDIAAAIGIEQLRKLPSFNAQRVANAQWFDQQLAGRPGLITPSAAPRRTHVYHQYTLRFLPEAPHNRDEVAQALHQRGISTGVYYPIPVHLQESMSSFGWQVGDFPVAERMAQQVLAIPVHPALSEAERMAIVDGLLSLC
jgi:perosamine synthetase